jgi:adenosylmethionine-8-amino-7-oxononanoate aminotransferase
VHRAILDAPAESKFMLGCTNHGHPTACAVALENLRIIDEENLVERAERMGARLNEGLLQLMEMPNVGQVRGLGLMAAVEVVAERSSREPFAASKMVGPKLARAMRERGVITRVKGDTILFAPPLVVTEAQVDTIVNTTAEAIEVVMGQMD